MRLDKFSLPARYLFPVSLGAALVCIYYLPFLFPPHPALSQSYVVGYNNQVAAVSFALVSVLVALLSLHCEGVAPKKIQYEPSVPWPWLAGALLLVAAWNGALSWLVFAAHNYGVEDYYFLPQVDKFYYLHRHLYSGIEFCYGQLLFYPPVWVHWLLSPFHISLHVSYYIASLLQYLLGVGMLYVIVNRMPMPRAMRVAAFACITLFSFNPALGPNYSLLRFMLPVFSYVLFSQIDQPVMAALAATVAQILIWMDSPEQAIGFGFAVTVYCCYRAWRQRIPLWLTPVAGAVAGTALYLAFSDPNVLFSFIHRSGWGNQVPLPSLEVVTLIVAAVWLVPRLVARHISHETPQSGQLLGLYALGLVLLLAMLSSSDIVHIVGDGAVFFLLSLVAVGEWKLPIRRLWVLTVAATYLLMVARWYSETHRSYNPNIACIDDRFTPLAARLPSRLAARLSVFEQKYPCPMQPLDVAALRASIGNAPFIAPFGMPEIVEETLLQIPNYVPSYWSENDALWNVEIEKKKVEEIRLAQLALLWGPTGKHEIPTNLDKRFALPTHYRALHVVYWEYPATEEFDNNWIFVGHIGDYLLYHRIR